MLKLIKLYHVSVVVADTCDMMQRSIVAGLFIVAVFLSLLTFLPMVIIPFAIFFIGMFLTTDSVLYLFMSYIVTSI